MFSVLKKINSTFQVQQTVSAERGENVTMLAFTSADGKSIPPVFIFPRKKLKPEMYDCGPVGCLGLCHQSGSFFLRNNLMFHKFKPFCNN